MNKEVIKIKAFEICKKVLPEWKNFKFDEFNFDDPKGFSSFTMGIRNKNNPLSYSVLFRKLEGKDNAILDFEVEKDVYLKLSENKISAKCLHYDQYCRIEAFYDGRTLNKEDLFQSQNLKGIAHQLSKFHQLSPLSIPKANFFDLLFNKWGKLAKDVLEKNLHRFPVDEQNMARELKNLYSKETYTKLKSALPEGDLSFCHNDTYHGNIMKLNNGEIKLLDFEFSCLNYKAYDFSNLFAETVMEHGLSKPPHFKINPPEFSSSNLKTLIDFYLENLRFRSSKERDLEQERLLEDALKLIKMSHYKYALAAIPLSLEPVQKIRFIPYAFQRWQKFLELLES